MNDTALIVGSVFSVCGIMIGYYHWTNRSKVDKSFCNERGRSNLAAHEVLADNISELKTDVKETLAETKKDVLREFGEVKRLIRENGR